MVAEALHDWLPHVIQAVDPWMSDSDIAPGDRWSMSLAKQLEDAHFGIICLTPDNLKAPWIHFEAGALSKIVERSHVCPYLFDLESKNVEYPLAQFQSVMSDKYGTKKLVYAINDSLENVRKLSEKTLDATFNAFWQDLDNKLRAIPEPQDVQESERDIEDMLGEMLELLRAQSSKISDLMILRNMIAHDPNSVKNITNLQDLRSRHSYSHSAGQTAYVGVAPTCEYSSPSSPPRDEDETSD